jgi:hypothetical protein
VTIGAIGCQRDIAQKIVGKKAKHRSPAAAELIANAATRTGLTVRCDLDTNTHSKGSKVSDQEMAT